MKDFQFDPGRKSAKLNMNSYSLCRPLVNKRAAKSSSIIQTIRIIFKSQKLNILTALELTLGIRFRGTVVGTETSKDHSWDSSVWKNIVILNVFFFYMLGLKMTINMIKNIIQIWTPVQSEPYNIWGKLQRPWE